jgi:hypothetical protein
MRATRGHVAIVPEISNAKFQERKEMREKEVLTGEAGGGGWRGEREAAERGGRRLLREVERKPLAWCRSCGRPVLKAARLRCLGRAMAGSLRMELDMANVVVVVVVVVVAAAIALSVRAV